MRGTIRRCVPGLLAAALGWAVGPAVSSASGSRAAVQPAASPASLSAADEAALKARAQAYWQRRQAKDLTGAYPFYCFAYRARVSLAEFLQMTRLVRFTLQSVDVARIVPNGDRVDVTVAYRFAIPTMPNVDAASESTDQWAREADGQWCKVDEVLVLPFPETPPPPP